MQNSSKEKDAYMIGKIIEYDNAIGKLIGDDLNQYTFLETNVDVKVGDIIKFRPETKDGRNHAFFLHPYDCTIGSEKIKVKE